jgi:predicted molibdopterin-dependent oxidoreductase YjgC
MAGAAVERVHELEFQRAAAEVELSPDDAVRFGVDTGDDVSVRSNGTSTALRARVNKNLARGVVRVAQEHASELGDRVEVSRA